jgi:hypothetical protein
MNRLAQAFPQSLGLLAQKAKLRSNPGRGLPLRLAEPVQRKGNRVHRCVHRTNRLLVVHHFPPFFRFGATGFSSADRAAIILYSWP